MFYHNINPVLLHIGPLEIRYYGLAYAIGFILVYLYLKKSSNELKLKKEEVENYTVMLALSVILSARIFYILFYNLKFYLEKPLEMLMLWHGGLSFHGGLFGAVLMSYLYCKKKKLSFLKLADHVIIPISFALFLGRIANFINGELYGRITSVPWAVKFPNAEGFRHPSQLYEAAKNLLIFFVLLPMKKRKLRDGIIFAVFLTLYGSIRFALEFFREPEVYLIGLTMGQFLSLITLLVGGIILLSLMKPLPKQSL